MLLVFQKLRGQEELHKRIFGLAEIMASTLDCIQNVEQYATLAQLKTEIENIKPLIGLTTNFILEKSSHDTGCTPVLLTNISPS